MCPLGPFSLAQSHISTCYILFPYLLLQWSIPTPFFKFIIFKIILVYVCTYIYVYACTYIHIFVLLLLSAFTYIPLVHMYVHTYGCMYIAIHTRAVTLEYLRFIIIICLFYRHFITTYYHGQFFRHIYFSFNYGYILI